MVLGTFGGQFLCQGRGSTGGSGWVSVNVIDPVWYGLCGRAILDLYGQFCAQRVSMGCEYFFWSF